MAFQLPPLTPENSRWDRTFPDSGTVQRLANGTEAWVGIKDENAKGQYDLFLNTTLRIGDISLSLEELKEHLVPALVHGRFQHPEVACTATWQETGPPHIIYNPMKNAQEALAWANETIETFVTSKNGFGVRAELEVRRREDAAKSGPKSAKSVVIFLIADVADEKTSLASGTVVDVLMHFNHIYWDGISARVFMGDLLREIGRNWNAERQLPEYNWAEEAVNLSPPILDAMKIEVEALGDDFTSAREQFISSLIKSGSSWGLNVKNAIGIPRTELYTFSAAQSEAIIQAVKSRLGPQYTISHLAHAATVLALLKAKPLPSDATDSQLVTPLPVNGRRFLQDCYAKKQFGACQAGAVVEFEDLKSWVVDENDKEAVVAMLERGCKHVKESYDFWLSKQFLLAMGVSKDNFLSKFLSENPMPFTGSSIPIFVTDGVVDRYVPGEVVSTTGQKLMTVDNCVFFLDTYLPDILIRMDSWKGATAFSLCFNDGYFSAEDAAAFLKYIAEFMLAFVQ